MGETSKNGFSNAEFRSDTLITPAFLVFTRENDV